MDLIGFAAVARLEERLDEPDRPSDLAAHMRTSADGARCGSAGSPTWNPGTRSAGAEKRYTFSAWKQKD